MKVRSKYWLVNDDGQVVFGEGRRKMLDLIDELGSMQAAAKVLGMSYRGVWARIKATEERLGIQLIETSVGRGKNRGSRLTPEGKKLLDDFRTLTEKGLSQADQLFGELFQKKGRLDVEPVVPVVAVVGLPGSGKTGLIHKLADVWTRRGRRVGVIQHVPGDQAGQTAASDAAPAAPYVTISQGPGRLEIRIGGALDLNPESIAANYALGTDVVLFESSERIHLPTIELYREDMQTAPLTRRRRDIVAVVGDVPPEHPDWPHYGRDDLEGVIECVEEQVLKARSEENRVKLVVDGRRVPMLPFVQNIFENALVGMVESLKACDAPRDIDLCIRRD